MTRLMCSQDRAEVESVKKELFRAGIPSEIRSNPLAAALRVVRLELWVHNEHDFFKASKLYAGMHAHAGKGREEGRRLDDNDGSEGCIEVSEVADESRVSQRRGSIDVPTGERRGHGNEELEQARALLEKDVEEVLAKQAELETACSSLRDEVKELSKALEQAKGALNRETETRAAAEKKRETEVSGLQSALDAERASRARVEAQLEQERLELGKQLKTGEAALKETHQKLDAKTQQLQAQQTTVIELRKEIVAREQEWQEHEKALSKARAELTVEREARKTAEDRADRSTAAQESLKAELGEQKDLQQQLRSHVASLNSLRSKLHAKRA